MNESNNEIDDAFPGKIPTPPAHVGDSRERDRQEIKRAILRHVFDRAGLSGTSQSRVGPNDRNGLERMQDARDNAVEYFGGAANDGRTEAQILAESHARYAAAVRALGPYKFIPGDRVYRTTTQHSEPGKIMCVFTADDKRPRYVFQYDKPKGLLHIAPEWQLTPESHGPQPLMVGQAVGAEDATGSVGNLPGDHV